LVILSPEYKPTISKADKSAPLNSFLAKYRVVLMCFLFYPGNGYPRWFKMQVDEADGPYCYWLCSAALVAILRKNFV
jgi:hypothetical protein